MSQENVEVVRGGLEAALRRPKPDFATLNALYHPAHELISRRDALEGGSHRGARGYREWLLDSEDLLPWQSSLEEVTEIDDDRVLAVIPTRNTGTSSGVVVDQRLAMVVTVSGGKIMRTEVFGSRLDALKAVGLAE
jgi:ketosteroid isomerase-like protein